MPRSWSASATSSETHATRSARSRMRISPRASSRSPQPGRRTPQRCASHTWSTSRRATEGAPMASASRMPPSKNSEWYWSTSGRSYAGANRTRSADRWLWFWSHRLASRSVVTAGSGIARRHAGACARLRALRVPRARTSASVSWPSGVTMAARPKTSRPASAQRPSRIQGPPARMVAGESATTISPSNGGGVGAVIRVGAVAWGRGACSSRRDRAGPASLGGDAFGLVSPAPRPRP